MYRLPASNSFLSAPIVAHAAHAIATMWVHQGRVYALTSADVTPTCDVTLCEVQVTDSGRAVFVAMRHY